jgi:hypothetical protein
MLYHEMGANQEHRMEIRRQVEHNRLEARLAQARLSKDTALQERLPYIRMLTGPVWWINERRQRAGW